MNPDPHQMAPGKSRAHPVARARASPDSSGSRTKWVRIRPVAAQSGSGFIRTLSVMPASYTAGPKYTTASTAPRQSA